MDGAAAASELITAGSVGRGDRVCFEIATEAHDSAIRRLLRDTPMPGQISLSLEREPSFFTAASIEGAEHRTIVALEGSRVIASGSVSARQRFINGHPMRVGYLSGLRLDASRQGQVSIIRRGYEMLRELHEQDGPEIYLTSIVADNFPARRLLERGLKGMPTYRFLGEFVTLVIRCRQRTGLQFTAGSGDLIPSLVELLNQANRHYQFAPVWSVENLLSPGLSAEDFCIACAPDGKPTACAAIWDQRSFKQMVVRGYSSRLRRLRPVINAAAGIVGRSRLPAVGGKLANAFISHLAADPEQPESIEHFLRFLQGLGHARQINYLAAGFDVRDPRLPLLCKAFHPHQYRSRLYAVHWDDGADLARQLDNRLLAPEVALL